MFHILRLLFYRVELKNLEQVAHFFHFGNFEIKIRNFLPSIIMKTVIFRMFYLNKEEFGKLALFFCTNFCYYLRNSTKISAVFLLH